MEPRGCSYLHFISVIKDGEVIKTPNISGITKVLQFKTVEEIYASIGSTAKSPLKVDRSLANGQDEVNNEVKFEFTDEENEPDFDLMTLKQFQSKCKSKKRKASIAATLTAVKKEDIDSQHQEDELDLKETLGSWKRKLSKKTKAKKSAKKCVSLSSKTNSLRGRSEDFPYDQVQQTTSRKVYELMRIKVEEEFGYSQPQPISCIIPANPRNATIEKVEAIEHSSLDEDIKTTQRGLQNLYLSGNSLERFLHPTPSFVKLQSCGLNQTSNEHVESCQLMNPLITSDSTITDVKKVNGTVDRSDQSLDLSVMEPRKEEGTSDLMMCDEATVQDQICLLNQASYEYLDCVNLQNPFMSADPKIEEFIKVDGKEVSGDEPLLSLVSDLKCEEAMNIPMTSNDVPATLFLEYDRSNFQDYNAQYLCALRLPLQINNSIHIPAPWASPDMICQDITSNDNGKSTTGSVVGVQSSTVKSAKCLPSASNLASRGNIPSSVGGKQSPMHDVTNAHTISSPDIMPSAPAGLLAGSSASESCQDDILHPPERLFSARKMISPNSQERLCRVMKSIRNQEDSEAHFCRENLSPEKDYKDKSSKSDIRRGRIIFTSKRHETVSNINIGQVLRKGKGERKSLHAKGIPKGPHASHIPQHVASRCSSIQSCSQNAIQFSQQQMNDIERLAQKLVTELHSMKDIFVDALQCESRTGARLRYNTDEVRVAVENATKVEEMSRKWLSMMSRDCNRFCKIMGLSEADAGTPENMSHKGRKIVFADEAGGKLCHVRVFEASEVGIGVASPEEAHVREGALGA